MAYLAGMTNRLGRVEDGNTVSDFDKEEIKRHFSISTYCDSGTMGQSKRSMYLTLRDILILWEK